MDGARVGRSSASDWSVGTSLLLGAEAGEILGAALEASGERLADWEVRNAYLRGGAASVVYDARLLEGGEEVLLVGHVSSREVPAGPAQVTVEGGTVHVWRYPGDPYLPGLPSALSARRVRELLDRLGVTPGRVQLRARSYRPTRRAVVEVTVAREDRRVQVLYLKVLGGRTSEHVRRRTRQLAHPHRVLREAGLPVPAVVGVAETQGIVALSARPGRTLRSLLCDPQAPLPEASAIRALSEQIAEIPLDGSADPRGFASAGRFVGSLAAQVPDLADTIREVAAEADTAAGPIGTVHGDLHDGQLLFAQGELSGLLDVDGAGTGLLAHDAGRLVAYIDTIGEQEATDIRRVRGFQQDLLEAHTDLVAAEDLHRAVAGALLSLATHPGHVPRDDLQTRTRDRVRRAAQWLEGPPG